jgi:hypothetical protein
VPQVDVREGARPAGRERAAYLSAGDGAADLEFRLATEALELEKSGLSHQRVPPTNR